MIKPMIVDLKVDATLGDGFYYFFYSQKELGFTKSYLHSFLRKAINRCGIWEHLYIFREVKYLQTESGLERYYLYRISSLDCHPVIPYLHLLTATPKRVHDILTVSHSSPFSLLDWYLILNSSIATLLTFHFPGAIVPKFHTHLEAVAQRCSVKKVFLEISQNPQENAFLCTGVFLWILRNF